MRKVCLAVASTALLVSSALTSGCNGDGSGDSSDDTGDGADVDAGESGASNSGASNSATVSSTATPGDDDWGDEGDDDGWGDDAGEDDGGNGLCTYDGVYGLVEFAGSITAPGSVHTYYCQVGEVDFDAADDWAQLRASLRCREGDDPEFESGLSVEASPGFARFITDGDRLRITRGFADSGPDQGLRIGIERDGEGRILSAVEGSSLDSSIGPDPTLPFFRGVESMGCTASDHETCGDGPAQRLVFETPAGFTRVGHQEAKLGQPPGDLNVWVGQAYASDSPGCDSPVNYRVLMIRD